MKKCLKCKNKIALIYCNSCSTFFCLECDRLTHNQLKNKKHKRENITTSVLITEENLKNNDNQNYKSPKYKPEIKGYKSQNNFHKISTKEDPNTYLIKKLEYNLNNDLDFSDEKFRNEKLISEYKNDFNKLYKYIKITNIKNNIDVNSLLNIIEEQDNIINNLFKKVYFLKKKLEENTPKNENYFNKKLDIMHKIYEKQKEELIKEQEDKIMKLKLEYNKIKDKYNIVIKSHYDKLEQNGEMYHIIKKLQSDQNNINVNTNKLSKINDELNIAEFCLNEHLDELVYKLVNDKRIDNNQNKINENKKIQKEKYIRSKSFKGKIISKKNNI